MKKVAAAQKLSVYGQQTVFAILFAVSLGHFLNDMLQSVLSAVYPMLKSSYGLTFAQIGFITFAFQCTASLLQPFVGNYTDKHPRPYSFVAGMCFSLSGITLLAFAADFGAILLAACFIGIGSSIFHPEASRVAYFASGGRRGLAQSIFQLGGNFGTALGPLLVTFIVLRNGQQHILWFLTAAGLAIIILIKVGTWYQAHIRFRAKRNLAASEPLHALSPKRVRITIAILLTLIFSKYFYTAGISNYLTFYLMKKFQLDAGQAILYLFVFSGSVAAGTLIGGPMGDRFGRKVIIWFSILGVAPFTVLLPYCDLFWTGVLISLIGLIIASAFSAILVYAQELLPGKIGMVSGLFFGFAFGMGGLGSAVLGYFIDVTSLDFVFRICSYLPFLGLIAAFLPNIKKKKKRITNI